MSDICQYPNCDRAAIDGRLCDHHAADRPASDEQTAMFGDELAPWFDEWQGMPEFVQEDLSPKKSIIVHFENLADLKAFAELVGQRITPNTQSIWYPEAEIGRFADKRFNDREAVLVVDPTSEIPF